MVTFVEETCSKKKGKVNRLNGLKMLLLRCYIEFGPKSQESRVCFGMNGCNTVSRWIKFWNKSIFIPKLGGMCLHQNLEEESQGLESSRYHVIKESIACRSISADSNAKTRIGFLQIAPADNDKGYDRRRDKTCWTLQKGKD